MSQQNQKSKNRLYLLLAGISIGLGGYTLYKYFQNDNQIKLSSFFNALDNNQINQIKIINNNLFFKSQQSDWYYTCIARYPIQILFNKFSLTPNLSYSTQSGNQLALSLLTLLGSTASILLATYLTSPTSRFGLNNKKSPKIINNKQLFQNFYGSEEIKDKLKQLIDFMKNQQKYNKLGARLRKGILLHGPPGTGKTMLAKTLANQANLPFIQTCASQFEQIYVGVGPKKIRQLFQKAKQCQQGCIIFIDQLDAIGSRGQGLRFSRQTTATINQLLTQLDGFQSNNKIVVIGATNRIDLVDQALIRAGRFDLKIKLNLPSQNQRLGILKTLLKKKKIKYNIAQETLKEISQQSLKWNGADIQTLINQAIYIAIRRNEQMINDDSIRQAFKQIVKN